MEEQNFLSKVMRGLRRDRGIGWTDLIKRGASLASETAAARVFLRSFTQVGLGARLIGRVRVENRGAIVAGRGISLNGSFMPIELTSGREGRIELGDGVWLNFGSVIAAASLVKIGARAQIGPHCIVSDVDVPEAAAGLPAEGARPVEIGEDAWLAGRVTVLPGVKIGAGAVITAGSIVETDIPAGVVAGGIPARIIRSTLHAAENGSGNGAAHAPTPAATAPATASLNGAASAPEPLPPDFTGELISDFTIDELSDELAALGGKPSLAAEVAPFGQVAQALLGSTGGTATDFAVVWTRPEGAVPAFARALAFEEVTEAELNAEVDAFTALLERGAERFRFMLVPTWVLPAFTRGLGMLEGRNGGVYRALLSMNLRLMQNVARMSNVFTLDAERWHRSAGAPATTHRAWYLGKIAVPRSVMVEAAADIRAAIGGLTGAARKLVVVDLDDTLWGGIVGDLGWEALRLGGHDPVGEALVDFQRGLKALKRRGIVLAIVSKNEESVALEAIRKHPEMVLREDDFVGWRINWNDKARNVAELAQELNLGLQSVVFIDDNPVERARVREALPEVLVPEWPVDKLMYPSAFQSLGCFDAPAISREDLERTRMYAEERKRERLQQEVGSIDDWLMSLGIRVRVEPVNSTNLTRTAQLLNKTNQLNLATRRLTELELMQWVEGAGRKLWTISVSDRFGDSGLTGIVSVEVEAGTARVVDYLLSCRVMGRKVEEAMLHIAASSAVQAGATELVAEYLQTAKNKPCLSFFQRSGLQNQEDRLFRWDLTGAFPLPAPVTLDWAN